jgi:hypothetical protein
MENSIIKQTAKDIVLAKGKGASRILTFGSNLVQNGLSDVIDEFIQNGWINHLATTGTSIVDDWNVARGDEPTDKTFYYINLAILVGNWLGLGFGEAVSKVICDEMIFIPEASELEAAIRDAQDTSKVEAAAELLGKIRANEVPSGRLYIRFPNREHSIMYRAAKADIPFTVHPQFGLDDLFLDSICSFAAIGHASEVDFLYFTSSVYNLEDGIYISVGSSVASPMIFEKALSMSQNVRIQRGCKMHNHKIIVVDLSESKWDWMANGEPPENRPEYYLRFCKSFSRAAAKSMYYISADNRDFFRKLDEELRVLDGPEGSHSN